jgi:hypothetical protein
MFALVDNFAVKWGTPFYWYPTETRWEWCLPNSLGERLQPAGIQASAASSIPDPRVSAMIV